LISSRGEVVERWYLDVGLKSVEKKYNQFGFHRQTKQNKTKFLEKTNGRSCGRGLLTEGRETEMDGIETRFAQAFLTCLPQSLINSFETFPDFPIYGPERNLIL